MVYVIIDPQIQRMSIIAKHFKKKVKNDRKK